MSARKSSLESNLKSTPGSAPGLSIKSGSGSSSKSAPKSSRRPAAKSAPKLAPPIRNAKRPISLHQRILTDIQDHILSGEWPPGHRIPFEHELMAQYRCSRMTVSKVLTRLASASMIERRRKAGSFVSRPRSQSAVLEIPDIKTEVAALGLPYRFEILGRHKRRSNRQDRELLNAPSPVPVLELICRHFAGRQPFCFEERLINLVAVPEAAHESFHDVAPGAWLLSRVPWSMAEHRIRATEALDAAAEALEIRKGKPCLAIERKTWSAGHAVTFVRLTYPGKVHELVASFAPEPPAPGAR